MVFGPFMMVSIRTIITLICVRVGNYCVLVVIFQEFKDEFTCLISFVWFVGFSSHKNPNTSNGINGEEAVGTSLVDVLKIALRR